MDAWAVLGVPPGSSERAIRAAYLRRARELHPDVGGTDEAMRALNAAYDQLSSTPSSPNWSSERAESVRSEDQFVDEPPPAPRPSPTPIRITTPKPPIYKRRWPYAMVVLFVVFLLTSGATNEPTNREKPAIYGLIGRCVELVDREIADIVPCAGPHDAWVIDVIERPGTCPPLANSYLNEISHIICINTEK